jgi:hypothetical protein
MGNMSESEKQKSTDQMLNEKIYPALIFVLSLVAFILFFVTDFAGVYIYDYYEYYPYIYRYVHMFSETIWYSFIWMLPLASTYAISGFLSFMVIFKPDSKWGKQFNLIFLISASSAALTIFAGIIFILTAFDATDWWFGTAFYGGFIGGALNTVFSYLILRGRGESIKFSLKLAD